MVKTLATERAYWLAWSQIRQVGPVAIKRLWEHFGSLEVAWRSPANALLAVDGIGLLTAEKIASQRPKLDPARLLAQHEEKNQSFWTPADADYPALLFAINDPPPVLYYRGSLRLNAMPNVLTVGMVGTRRPSPYGQRWTQKISSYLTKEGATIISGLAAGIDTAAHESCLSHQGLTVAVLGTGVDKIYPYKNRALYEQIIATGLVVSEYPDGTGPDKTHFPQRNRIIAGLSRATLVMEAPARSGALITSRLANDYCREVYALPCGLDNPAGLGCLDLIAQGAQMILGEAHLAAALAALPPVDAPIDAPIDETAPNGRVSNGRFSNGRAEKGLSAEASGGDSSSGRSLRRQSLIAATTALDAGELDGAAIAADVCDLSPMLSQVLNAVSIEPTVLDRIVQLAQLETGSVLAALTQLEMLGLVSQLPGMQYQRG